MNETSYIAHSAFAGLLLLVIGRIVQSFRNGNSLLGAIKDTLFGTNIPKEINQPDSIKKIENQDSLHDGIENFK